MNKASPVRRFDSRLPGRVPAHAPPSSGSIASPHRSGRTEGTRGRTDKKRIALGLGLPGIEAADSRSYFDRLVTIDVQNLEDYYLMVKVHTNTSFWTATAAGIVGFALVLGGVVIGLANPPNSALLASITSASGVITGFIAAVFFCLYNRSVVQLKEYHDSLLTVQNVLLAFKIVSDTSDATERVRMTGRILEYLMVTKPDASKSSPLAEAVGQPGRSSAPA